MDFSMVFVCFCHFGIFWHWICAIMHASGVQAQGSSFKDPTVDVYKDLYCSVYWDY